MNGLYIHIPFCERKCFYCDFYSISNLSLIQSFFNALSKEILLYSEQFKNKYIGTIYFGGGTPSVVKPNYIEHVLNDIAKHYSVNSQCEITIECNPNSINKEKINNYKNIGINRISLGVQSFDSSELVFLQRLHNTNEARNAIELVNSIFDNVSIDLIYAIPNSSIKTVHNNLTEILFFKPKHISAYGLIYENNTRLTKANINGEFKRIDEELNAEMYRLVMSYLQNNGYIHYDVSNYCLPNFESKHNSNYWNHTDYIGLGPSAHSFVNNKRFSNYSDMQKYINSLMANILPIEFEEIITNDILFEEYIFLGLRSTGIDLKKINRKFEIDFLNNKKNIITLLQNDEYLAIENDFVKLTDKGFLGCDEMCTKLFS
jgi:oxygen-independent coproporphyrinogen-3 oxidase